MINARHERALEIADKFRITNNGPIWTVPSQSTREKYTVRILNDRADCTLVVTESHAAIANLFEGRPDT